LTWAKRPGRRRRRREREREREREQQGAFMATAQLRNERSVTV
jgi:hypothetical protein